MNKNKGQKNQIAGNSNENTDLDQQMGIINIQQYKKKATLEWLL